MNVGSEQNGAKSLPGLGARGKREEKKRKKSLGRKMLYSLGY